MREISTRTTLKRERDPKKKADFFFMTFADSASNLFFS